MQYVQSQHFFWKEKVLIQSLQFSHELGPNTVHVKIKKKKKND